jgi:MFS family permease
LPSAPDAGAGQPAGPWRAALVCFLPFAVGYFISFVFRTINAVAGPDIAGELDLDATRLGLVTSAYFLAFAAMQLPVGIALDRFGPRRVEATLLLVAALGAIVFAQADGLGGLTLGRALLGAGVSGCLMAAIKANVLFWPREKLPLLNGLIMGFGGLGATAAALPVEWLLQASGWRAVFTLLALPTVIIAAAIYFIVPERSVEERTSLGDLLRGLGSIYRSRVFWRLAPSAAIGQAVFMAYHSLWAGIWLRDVVALERGDVASQLSLFAIAMIPSYVGGGALTGALLRRGFSAPSLLAGFVAAYVVVQMAILLWPERPMLWVAYSITGTGMVLSFALLAPSFTPSLAGRVTTALNLQVFVIAFGIQVGVGALVSLFAADGSGAATGHRLALAILVALQVVAFLWLIWPRRNSSTSARPGG